MLSLFSMPKLQLERIIKENSGSLIRTVIYTIGHFIIAAACVWYFTGTNVIAAVTDAIVEPLINAGWYFVLDRIWTSRVINKKAPETEMVMEAS